MGFTLDATHRLQSGPTLKEAVLAVESEAGEDRPHFYGINCSHPYEFDPALEPGDWILRVRSVRPNAAAMEKVALCTLGHLEEGDPVELGTLAGALARRFPHLDVWGGCCGTWEKHLDEIARNVAAVHRGRDA
jgi:S-methylmethionine-dependent homocysteine/selenocysteine methylase